MDDAAVDCARTLRHCDEHTLLARLTPSSTHPASAPSTRLISLSMLALLASPLPRCSDAVEQVRDDAGSVAPRAARADGVVQLAQQLLRALAQPAHRLDGEWQVCGAHRRLAGAVLAAPVARPLLRQTAWPPLRQRQVGLGQGV